MKSIRSKLIIIFAALLLVSDIFVGYMAINRLKQTIKEEAEFSLARLASDSATITN